MTDTLYNQAEGSKLNECVQQIGTNLWLAMHHKLLIGDIFGKHDSGLF